jgi:hypothetical protein
MEQVVEKQEVAEQTVELSLEELAQVGGGTGGAFLV